MKVSRRRRGFIVAKPRLEMPTLFGQAPLDFGFDVLSRFEMQRGSRHALRSCDVHGSLLPRRRSRRVDAARVACGDVGGRATRLPSAFALGFGGQVGSQARLNGRSSETLRSI